ncbi:MAG: outer membrane lipoprotein carrier protein LolA [Nitrospirota bacterium]|nr:MAG: outer membrane lipoprotein carrier protein LolA [Nitrospirota bacterium]
MNGWGGVWLGVLMVLGTQTLGYASPMKQVLDLVGKVDSRYEQTQDLQADFSQETKIEGFETRLSSKGRVLLKKPGMLRWDYVEPSVEQIFVDGDQVMVYTPEHKQVVKANLTQIAASKAPLALLQGAGKLAEHFDVLPTDQEESRQEALPLITLVPKPEEKERSAVTRVVLEIDPSSFLIKKMDLHEISGNISTLHFSNFKVNQGIDTAQLKLNVPEDVIVVDAPVVP